MGERIPIPHELDGIAREIVDAAYAVHSTLGPGLLESVYEVCLAHELDKRDLAGQRQVNAPVVYDGLRIESGLRVDMLVEDQVIVELKVVDRIKSVHVAQLLTYLKLMDKRLGLLINFDVPLIKDGIRRIVR